MKFVVNKILSEHEQIQVEIPAKNADDARERLNEVWPILDSRLIQQGMRVAEAHEWIKGMPTEVQAAVKAVLGILFGKQGAMQDAAIAKEAIAHREADMADLRKQAESLHLLDPEPKVLEEVEG